MTDLGHWSYTGILTESTEIPFGFVYIITNCSNNKKYICKSPHIDIAIHLGVVITIFST